MDSAASAGIRSGTLTAALEQTEEAARSPADAHASGGHFNHVKVWGDADGEPSHGKQQRGSRDHGAAIVEIDPKTKPGALCARFQLG